MKCELGGQWDRKEALEIAIGPWADAQALMNVRDDRRYLLWAGAGWGAPIFCLSGPLPRGLVFFLQLVLRSVGECQEEDVARGSVAANSQTSRY